jgi:hypothetical protein
MRQTRALGSAQVRERALGIHSRRKEPHETMACAPCPHQHEASSISLSLIRPLQGPHAASCGRHWSNWQPSRTDMPIQCVTAKASCSPVRRPNCFDRSYQVPFARRAVTSVHPGQHRPCASDHVADTGLLKRHSSKESQQFTGWV